MMDLAKETVGFIGIFVLLAMIFLRVPVGVAVATVSVGGIFIIMGERSAIGLLSSIPMFLFMGYLCYHAGLTTGLFRLARLWLSWMPGGLSVASIQGSALFATVTGSSLTCTAAMGRIAAPEMLKASYDKGLATGTIAAAGTIGSMIPPSILLVIYGIFVEQSIAALFLGALIPGIMTAVLYSLMVVVRCWLKPSLAPKVREDVTWGQRFAAFTDTWPVIVLVVCVFGRLFTGVFTPTEAGAVGAALAFLIGLLKRALSWPILKGAIGETLRTTATIFLIAIRAQLLTRFFALAGTTHIIADWIGNPAYSQLQVILIISLILILLGMLLEPIGIMLLTIPILLPVLETRYINLIWFGVLMAKFLEIGFITPPVGLNVSVVKGIVCDLVPIHKIFTGIIWFVVVDFFIIAALIGFSQIILWLLGL